MDETDAPWRNGDWEDPYEDLVDGEFLTESLETVPVWNVTKHRYVYPEIISSA